MAHVDEYMRKQKASILQLRSLTKCIKEDRVPSKIEEGLFLGSVGAANNKDELKRLNITHILVVAKSIRPAYPNDFVYKVIEGTANGRSVVVSEISSDYGNSFGQQESSRKMQVVLPLNVDERNSLEMLEDAEVVTDREDVHIREHFDDCFEFIDEAKNRGGGVLVHCFMGRSRSVSVVVAYLMKKHRMSLSQAMEHVKSKRPKASPNSGFLSQLRDFDKSLISA